MKRIIHRGFSYYRTKKFPLEKAFAAAWEQTMERWTRMFREEEGGDDTVPPTQAEASAAATAIQWLGSPVGLLYT